MQWSPRPVGWPCWQRQLALLPADFGPPPHVFPCLHGLLNKAQLLGRAYSRSREVFRFFKPILVPRYFGKDPWTTACLLPALWGA